MTTMDNQHEIDIDSCSMERLLPSVFHLQSQRCITYQRLADAQSIFIATRQFIPFQNFISDITVIFSRISEDILRIKDRLQSNKLIVRHIEQLQDYEQKKLQWTNDLFLAKIEKKFEEAELIQKKLTDLILDINDILQELRYDQEECFSDDVLHEKP